MHIFDTLNFFWQAEDELNWIMCYKVKSTCTVTKGEDRGHLHLTSIRVTGPLPDGIIMIVHHPRLIPNTHTHELFHTKDNQRCVLFATVCITVTDCLISRLPLAVDPFRATLLHVSYEVHYILLPSSLKLFVQPATERGDPIYIYRAVDALTSRLCATPWPIHITDRGCGAYRWWRRVGRSAEEPEDQS